MRLRLKFVLYCAALICATVIYYSYSYRLQSKSNRFDVKFDNSNALLIGQDGRSDLHIVCLSNGPRLLLRTRFPEEHDPGNGLVSGVYDTVLYINAHDRSRLMGGAVHGSAIHDYKAKIYIDFESYYHRDLILANISGLAIRRVLSNITEKGYFWIYRDELAVELNGRIDGSQINPFIERCQRRG